MSPEDYKHQHNFDTNNGVDRGTELYFNGDYTPYSDMFIRKIGFISLDDNGEVIANHPLIKDLLDRRAFHHWYDDERNIWLYQETYNDLSDERKEHYRLVWNTEEEREDATNRILESFEFFYSEDPDTAHREALVDNEFVDVANSLMALSFEYSQKNPDDIAFSGLVKPEDFDENGNLIREFKSEEAELAHMSWVDYLETVGIDDALAERYEAFREELLSGDFDAAIDTISESDGASIIFKMKLQAAFEVFEQYFGKISDGFINKHSARELIENLPALKRVMPTDYNEPEPGKRFRPIKFVPAAKSSYAISNAAFSKLTAGLAMQYIKYDYDDSRVGHRNNSEHTRTSAKHYWTLGDYTKY